MNVLKKAFLIECRLTFILSKILSYYNNKKSCNLWYYYNCALCLFWRKRWERERLKKYVTYITHNLYCTWPIGIWDYHSTHEHMVYISCYNNHSLASDKLQFWIEGFDLIFLHNNILEIFILAKKFRIWTLSKCNFKVTLFSACFC